MKIIPPSIRESKLLDAWGRKYLAFLPKVEEFIRGTPVKQFIDCFVVPLFYSPRSQQNLSVCWFVLLPVSLYISTFIENEWIFFSKSLHIWTFEILLKGSQSLKILTPVGFFLPIFVVFYVPLFIENGLTFSHQILYKYSWYYSGGHYTKKSKHGPLCWESF